MREKIKITQAGRSIAKQAFPDYKGRKFYLDTRIPTKLNSYWQDGYRDYYAFYNVSDGKILPVHSNHPVFEKDQPRDLTVLPDGVILLCHSYARTMQTITFYINENDLFPNMIKG